MNADVIVVGAGMIGAAVAYGLVNRNMRVLLLDGNDSDFRAASANFGLVWQQGKGLDMPAYQHLTRKSVELWPEFDAELANASGIDLQYERNGGLVFCLSQDELEQRRAELMRLDDQRGDPERDWEILDRSALAKLLPRVQLGQEVVGASLGHRDGHANPLRLLAALHKGVLRKGGELKRGCVAQAIRMELGEFIVDFGSGRVSAPRIVLAAGLGAKALAAQVGIDIPIRPQRGQILVTERLEPILPLPASGLRQTRDGTVMIGATHDDPGFDTSTTSEAAASLSAKAIRRVPRLGEARLVRQWAGLRILTPDGYPVYAESQTHPGAFVAVCHSGVTLAALHAETLADAIAVGRLPPSLELFSPSRFGLPRAA